MKKFNEWMDQQAAPIVVDGQINLLGNVLTIRAGRGVTALKLTPPQVLQLIRDIGRTNTGVPANLSQVPRS